MLIRGQKPPTEVPAIYNNGQTAQRTISPFPLLRELIGKRIFVHGILLCGDKA
jgi:hypothetical protein